MSGDIRAVWRNLPILQVRRCKKKNRPGRSVFWLLVVCAVRFWDKDQRPISLKFFIQGLLDSCSAFFFNFAHLYSVMNAYPPHFLNMPKMDKPQRRNIEIEGQQKEHHCYDLKNHFITPKKVTQPKDWVWKVLYFDYIIFQFYVKLIN